MTRAIRLYRGGRYEAAARAFETLSDDDRESPMYEYYYGLCAVHLGRHEDALHYLELAVALDIGFLQTYQCRLIIGYLHAIAARYRQAEFELRRLLTDGYESAKAYCALSYVEYKLGRIPAAISNLQKALAIDPLNHGAMNSLGFILAEAGTQLDVAESYCRQAVESAPNRAAYLDSLAIVLWKLGRLVEARDVFERALRSSKGNQEIVEHFKSFARAVGAPA